MRYDTRYRSRNSFFNSSLPAGVKWLLISNVAVFLIYFFVADRLPGLFFPLQLIPHMVVSGAIWQLVTYLFLQYYFLCGIGAGVCVVLVNLLAGNGYQSTIGASGAIYGLLLAYGMLFPEQELLFMFLFPLKAKYVVMIYGAIAFLGSFQMGGTVSNLAHLGGMIFGFVYIKTQFGRRKRVPGGFGGTFSDSFSFRRAWKDYKLKRAKKKFQVYMKKHGSGQGPWVN
jgi:membrane associated rhomboid family serine protease